MVVPKLTK